MTMGKRIETRVPPTKNKRPVRKDYRIKVKVLPTKIKRPVHKDRIKLSNKLIPFRDKVKSKVIITLH